MNNFWKIKNIILDILFPPLCLNCKNNLIESEKENKICKKCFESIDIYSSLFCPKCKSRTPNKEKTCHKEIKFLLAPVTDYQNPVIKNLIWFLKYHKWQSIILTIQPLINSYLDILSVDQRDKFNDYIVMPIPLHPDRLKERGFNQSDLISKLVSVKINGVLDINNLKRIKPTKKQADLKAINERMQNVEDCFALNKPKDIENKNIILVDDVFTTGSTMSEAVKILKAAGAKKIIALVFAMA